MKGMELYGTKVMPPVNAMPAGFDGWQCRTRWVQYVRRFSAESRLVMREQHNQRPPGSRVSGASRRPFDVRDSHVRLPVIGR